MPLSNAKTFLSSSLPFWVASVLVSSSGLSTWSVLLFGSATLLSAALVILRPRLLRRLLVPEGFENALGLTAQDSLGKRVAELHLVMAGAERVTRAIQTQIGRYVEEMFNHIEDEFRSGRLPGLEHSWYLLLGTLASAGALALLACLLAANLVGIVSLGTGDGLAIVALLLSVAMAVAFLLLALASRGSLVRQGLSCFPLLLTSPKYNEFAERSQMAAALVRSEHPLISGSEPFGALAKTRETGVQQRDALINAVVEQTSADRTLVRDAVTDFLESLVGLVIAIAFLAALEEVYR
ncbi:MAG TPA: hypothetical protein VGR51_05840, partial [Thermoplasmata archaeon]|nr:hypothetical protein [Thermoplasmata archaeon]